MIKILTTGSYFRGGEDIHFTEETKYKLNIRFKKQGLFNIYVICHKFYNIMLDSYRLK